jgi:hypothetical protein
MKKKPTTAATPLEAAIQVAYETFGAYQAPQGPLDVCTDCCMDADLEREMRHLPLRQLTEKHFYQYNDSAKSEVQPADEIKYYLPRMLELLAQGAQLHHSTEIYLDRVGRCEAGAYSSDEKAALLGFARAFFTQGLAQWAPDQESLFQFERAFSILLMWDYAGVPIQPMLNDWLADDREAATLNFVDSYYWEYWMDGSAISNAFAEPPFQAAMQNWLSNRDIKAAWSQKVLKLIEERPPSDWRPACSTCGSTHHPLAERINTVFDALTNE